ncbi:MAG TPA: hypothetical protein VKX39_16620 [Bryobacteraceae bacterium]|nr:hypothetical protein [Bryobacteraceae bacterium]
MSFSILACALVHAQNGGMNMVDMNPSSMYLANLASGTSVNPDAWAMPMRMAPLGRWNTMLMGNGFLVDTQQTGPRGHDKLYSTNWMMAAAEHRLGSGGAFQAVLMLSLEPATITNRSYPLLFQTGETAYGKPLIDAQHPHNFIMALGFHYTNEIAEHTFLDLYFAPVGDPALGPVAFPHRASALEIPQAPLAHHLQDSTHISDEVLTAGIQRKKVKLEASGFHGAEPGENRWIIQTGGIDSWSARVWYFPSANWAAQVSAGRLHHPEALEPGDQFRSSASLAYTKGRWSSSLIWGRAHLTDTHANLNSYLAETVAPIARKNFVTGRVELADKELSVPGVYRIRAYTAGYTRDIDLARSFETGVGANISFYSIPESLKPVYSDHPAGVNLYLRVRLRSN